MLSVAISAAIGLSPTETYVALQRRTALVALSGIALGVAPPPVCARTPLPAEPFVRKPLDFGSLRIGSRVGELASGCAESLDLGGKRPNCAAQRAASKAATIEAVQTEVCEAYRKALATTDVAALRAVHTPGALVYDAFAPGRPVFSSGADVTVPTPALSEPIRVNLLSLVHTGVRA